MPPQIKQDLNRSGWESTDFPSVCESCLPENPYVKMLKEDYGAECKLCTRPFTVFSWSADRAHGRKKRTNICLTCARLKNCCQSCMLDLSFGLPIVVRDAALKMVAPGPSSDINREYFAQNNERAIEEGSAGVEEYEKTDDKARELLRRLAANIHVMSLFVTGVEDDLPEHKIREFFKVHGKIKSLVCSHMSHCAFVNYETREAAEKAAMACQGRAVIAGCPLRVRWGMPKAIGTMDKEQRSQVLTDARRSHGLGRSSGGLMAGQKQITSGSRTGDAATEPTIALPPGADNGPQYASLSGD
ncbi:Pre-mRNA-splicing factor slt-11 [Colletotrichum spinosum]|uniref:Pre-mRNA-splicing factor slt-11 n=1 Tax=Colletotrichum spinosum TaxID=1347390 RepID=A0A4R8Q2V8_9PEZI|nr:Pre-mRNA-splicing factor slt-11 [Colletotrichum spinosum]